MIRNSAALKVRTVMTQTLNDPITQSDAGRLAIIAGNGNFPFLVLDAARQQGIDPVIFAIKEEASPQLNEKTQSIHWLGLGEAIKFFGLLSSERVKRVVLAGQVKHAQIYGGFKADRVAQQALDGMERKNTDALIGTLVKMLEGLGIEVLDSTLFLRALLAAPGTLTRRAPDESELTDIAYGREVARTVAGLDIGQTVVVSERACVAVEAMEGTDATIERAASLCNGRRLAVVKVSKPTQDMRFDVPVVGVKTIEVMSRCGATALALDAGKTLLFERDRLLETANQAAISIVGLAD